jgi:hypothetical protein
VIAEVYGEDLTIVVVERDFEEVGIVVLRCKSAKVVHDQTTALTRSF